MAKKPARSQAKGAGNPAPTSKQLDDMAETMQQAARESMDEFKRSGDSYFYNQAGMEENLARQLKDQARHTAGGESRAANQKAVVRKRHESWLDNARLLIGVGRSKREVAAIIAKNAGVDPKTVREALKKEGFY